MSEYYRLATHSGAMHIEHLFDYKYSYGNDVESTVSP